MQTGMRVDGRVGRTSASATSPMSRRSSRRRGPDDVSAQPTKPQRSTRTRRSTGMEYFMQLEYHELLCPVVRRYSEALMRRQAHRAQVPEVRPRVRATARLLPDRHDRDHRCRRGAARRPRGRHQLHRRHAGPVLRPGGDRAVREGVGAARRAGRLAEPPGRARAARSTRCASACASRRCGRRSRSARSSEIGNRSWGSAEGCIRGWKPTGEPDVPADQICERGVLMAADPTSRSSGTRSRRRGDAPSSPSRSSSSRSSASAIERAGIERRDIGFTCAGSCDYLSGQTFAFVMNLEAVGAWPPISESHVEMDGAWALYEAWVRLQHGDIDTALVFGSGKSSPGRAGRDLPAPDGPVHAHAARRSTRCRSPRSRRARCSTQGMITEREMAETAARSRASANGNPYAQVSGDFDVDALLAEPYVTAPLRKHDLPPISDGACAVVLATADEGEGGLRSDPVWIRGIDHRIEIHQPGHARPHGVAVDAHRGEEGRRRRRRRSTSPSCRPRSRTRRSCCATSSGSPTMSTSTRRAARSRRTR